MRWKTNLLRGCEPRGNGTRISIYRWQQIISPNGDDQHFADHKEREIYMAQSFPRTRGISTLFGFQTSNEIHRFDDRHPEWYSRITDERDLGES